MFNWQYAMVNKQENPDTKLAISFSLHFFTCSEFTEPHFSTQGRKILRHYILINEFDSSANSE